MSIPGPAGRSVLSLRGVSKAYGAVQALRDVSVDCHAGEIHALVGENGSGKSTLLGIASGFVHRAKEPVRSAGRRGGGGPPAGPRGPVPASGVRPNPTAPGPWPPRNPLP